jgi:hypothetical protein
MKSRTVGIKISKKISIVAGGASNLQKTIARLDRVAESLRRLGEAGADSFTIMRVAGCSSVTV